MKLFLQIEINQWQNASYEKPLLSFASSLSKDLVTAEIDNQSDSAIVDMVIKLCNQADHIFVLVLAQPDQPLGSTLKLLHQLLRNDQRIHTVILSGNHEPSENLLRTLDQRFKKENDSEKIREWITGFALA